VVEEVWDVIDVRAPNNRRWSISPKTWTIHATFIRWRGDKWSSLSTSRRIIWTILAARTLGLFTMVFIPSIELSRLSYNKMSRVTSDGHGPHQISSMILDKLLELLHIGLLDGNTNPSPESVYDVVKLSQVPLFVLANHLSSQGDDANSSQTSYELDLLWHKS
ncbi:hypothetical protein MJO28_013281, partial [Puccinia striiformis f. sp. tritici]